MNIPGFREKKVTTVETPTGAEARVAPTTPVAEVDPANHVAGSAGSKAAYEQGLADARRADAAAVERERERARLAERPRRRRGGLGLIGLIVFLLAVLGGAWLFLAVIKGSFTQGGAVVDNKLSAVTEPAREAVANARNSTGQAVQNAGEALKNSGEKIKRP